MLGFFGDEPDYTSFIPWTPKLLEDFQAQKGYDLQPYMPLFFAGQLTDEARRAKADYYDVWSGIFHESLLRRAGRVVRQAHNVEYLVHLNHEEHVNRSRRRSDPQRGRLLPRQALRAGSRHR